MSILTQLEGHWPFDETTGTRAFDRSGNGNHGEFLNAARAPGIYGGAASLSGRDNSHVSIPASDNLNALATQLTVAAWVFPHVMPEGFRVAVSRQIGTVLHPDQFYLGFGPEDETIHYKWHLGTDDNGTVREGDLYRGTPEFGRWIHLAGTYDGAMMRLFVDGEEIGAAPLTGNLRVDDNPIMIGGEENGPTPQDVDGEFHGLIDEVRIYSRSLSASEIREIFQLDAS